jgi:DNA primase small subunit
LGGFYDKPSTKSSIDRVCTGKELVFDIDIDDYHDVLGVDKHDIDGCDRVFPIVLVGLEIIKHILEHHFGFMYFASIYSGRRGAHLHVLDRRAFLLCDEARDAIVSYISPRRNQNGSLSYRNFLTKSLFDRERIQSTHSSIPVGSTKTLAGPTLLETHILPFWINFGIKPMREGGLGIFDDMHSRNKFITGLGWEKQIRLCAGDIRPDVVWKTITDYAYSRTVTEQTILHEYLLFYIWPRIDANVTRSRHHLVKGVLTAHPQTNRICIPIVGRIVDFKPNNCPTVSDILNGTKNLDREITHLQNLMKRIDKKRSRQLHVTDNEYSVKARELTYTSRLFGDEVVGTEDTEDISVYESLSSKIRRMSREKTIS